MGALNTKRFFNIKGQSLIELLVAIGIAGAFIFGATVAVNVGVKSTTQTKDAQQLTQLAQELLDGVTTVAQSSWNSVANVTAPSFLSGSPLTVQAGEDSPIDPLYHRSFTVDGVSRNGSSDIDSAGTDDPATKLIRVTVRRDSAQVTLSKYITRYQTGVLKQTDWSGGGGQTSAAVDPTKFDTKDASIDVTTTPGSIQLIGLPTN